MNLEPKYYKFQEAFKWVADASHGIPKRVPGIGYDFRDHRSSFLWLAVIFLGNTRL